MNMQSNSLNISASLAAKVIAACMTLACAAPASAQTLDRVKAAGTIKLGYFTDAKPFSYRTEAGGAEGYGIDLCKRIVDSVKAQTGAATLNIEWVPLTVGVSDIRKIREGAVDLMCTPATETLLRREEASYSIPIFPAGVHAIVRKDASGELKQALGEGQPKNARVVWRGAPAAKTLNTKTFAVMEGSTTQSIAAKRVAELDLKSKTLEVRDYRSGLQAVLDGKADAFFGDRAVAFGAMDDAMRQKLVVLDRRLTQEPVGLLLPRGDEDFRLLIDRTLSDTYRSAEFPAMFEKWFGKPDDATRTFFRWTALMQ